MRFRPCIDLHQGRVKQIVGSTLRDGAAPVTNFEAAQPPRHFAEMYRRDGLPGGHVILLGPGNDAAATEALAAFPGGLQVGGGITPETAPEWIRLGADKVIVTSYIFKDGVLSFPRLEKLAAAVGRERLVLDLSCKSDGIGGYRVAINRWQTLTDVRVNRETFERLAEYCAEYLIHAVDVEGMRGGIDEPLVRLLAAECAQSVTYAGGVRNLADLDLVETLGGGRVDVTIGSALDIFGGTLPYADVVAWDVQRRL
jgi:phosphoribosylformimino-5-aminoimidazole carboxamide ribotide isomerase